MEAVASGNLAAAPTNNTFADDVAEFNNLLRRRLSRGSFLACIRIVEIYMVVHGVVNCTECHDVFFVGKKLPPVE